MRWRPSIRGTLGLDIGSNAVTLVAVRHTASGPRLEAAACAELPRGALHGHVVRDTAAVAHVVRELLAAGAARRWPVATAVPAPAVMMRRFTVAGAGASLDAAVVREAAAVVPDGLAHAVLDYQVLETADGVTRVLAVAARSELVRSYTGALRAAGLEPCVVDVDVFALHRARRASAGAGVDALVNVGARTVSVAVVGDDMPDFAGDVPAGPGVDVESTAAAVARLLDGAAPADDSGRPVVVLCGAAGRIAGFDEALSERTRWSVEVLDPFAGLMGRHAHDAQALGADPAAFGVAVGLALRCPERPWW